MSKYRIDRQQKRRGRRTLVVLVISCLIVGGLGGLVAWDMMRNSKSGQVSGVSRTVPQAEIKNAVQVTVDEPLYSFKLPGDWKEIERRTTKTETSVTWQAKRKGSDNRWFKLYIDTIPADFAVNRLLPVDATGDVIGFRQLSDNCANFTSSPTKEKLPTKSKWQQVEFVCDLGNFVQNKVGTSSEAGINTVKLTGATKGQHSYFFLYTDHNINPDYTILYDILRTFKAK